MNNVRMMFSRSSLPTINTVGDLRTQARRRLPKMIYEFVDGGADGEVTVAANRAAIDGVQFDPPVSVRRVGPGHLHDGARSAGGVAVPVGSGRAGHRRASRG